MDIQDFTKVKKWVLTGLASDDDLIESLVLKGGNAIQIGYSDTIGKVSRPSLDLDFSIANGDFKDEIDSIEKRIKNVLTQTFAENGYVLFDFRFAIKPKKVNEETHDFWGGYKAEFKLIQQGKYDSFSGDSDRIRRNAISINRNNGSPKFEIEFSKHEYADQFKKVDVDGYTIKVYTPEMIVFEKVRALCQQLPEYADVVKSFNPRARARDFYDIWLIMTHFEIDLKKEDNLETIKSIFEAKKVPLDFLGNLSLNKELHLENWKDVKDTLSISEEIEDFDFYFEFVLSKFERLKFP